jgi:hypothetical protein
MVAPYSRCYNRVVLVHKLVVPLYPYKALVCHQRFWNQQSWEEKPTYLQEGQPRWTRLWLTVLLSVISISCYTLDLHGWHGICSRVRLPCTPFLVFSIGTGMRVQLDSGCHVIRVDVKRPLEFSQGYLIRHRKDGRSRSLWLELPAKTDIDRLSDYRADI